MRVFPCEEKARFWSLRDLSLKLGVLWLQAWYPDFNSALQNLTNAQICVKFYDLYFEYWHPNILLNLVCGIKVLLRIDQITLSGDFSHFLRFL